MSKKFREIHFQRDNADGIVFIDEGPVVFASVLPGALASAGVTGKLAPWPPGEDAIATMLAAPAEKRGLVTVGAAWPWCRDRGEMDPQEILGRTFDRAMVRIGMVALMGGGALGDDDRLLVEVAPCATHPSDPIPAGWLLRLTSERDPRLFVLLMSMAPMGAGVEPGVEPMPVELPS